mmetsp:Transcript_20203/g.29755  ORF Transcript_20203/g.29755 Transcript_20203/m.29755 type:complete len:214 (-) Transcript_20203:224-865(-)
MFVISLEKDICLYIYIALVFESTVLSSLLYFFCLIQTITQEMCYFNSYTFILLSHLSTAQLHNPNSQRQFLPLGINNNPISHLQSRHIKPLHILLLPILRHPPSRIRQPRTHAMRTPQQERYSTLIHHYVGKIQRRVFMHKFEARQNRTIALLKEDGFRTTAVEHEVRTYFVLNEGWFFGKEFVEDGVGEGGVRCGDLGFDGSLDGGFYLGGG